MWLRLPLVEGYNDDVDHIRQLARLGRRIGAEKISLLPYHAGGSVKCEQIGRTDPAARARAPSQEAVEILRRAIVREGMVVGVGN